jgi:hypothetical protein
VTWFIQVDGLIVEAREFPPPAQARAFELGSSLISRRSAVTAPPPGSDLLHQPACPLSGDCSYAIPSCRDRGLRRLPALQDRLAVFTDKQGPSDFYQSFFVDKVRLDIRDLEPTKVISLVIPAERRDHQNIAKLKQLRAPEWTKLVDEVWLAKGGTDLKHFYEALQLDSKQQEIEALAARANMVRVVTALHDPSSQLLRALIRALSEVLKCQCRHGRVRRKCRPPPLP